MPLTAYYKSPVATAREDQTVREAARLMQERNVGCIVITREDRPIGILTDRDIALRVVAEGKDPDTFKVKEVMTTNLITARDSIGVWELVELMREHAIRRMPIVSGEGKLAGIVTLDDLFELFAEEMFGLGQVIGSATGRARPAVVKA